VHFPTDSNLAFDALRKAVKIIAKLCDKHQIIGWRKSNGWLCNLKGLLRTLGKVNQGGGNDKEQRLKKATKNYTDKAKELAKKINETLELLKEIDNSKEKLQVECFYEILLTQIDLIERRILNEEKIPHSEKVFSVFESWTKWINKGKAGNKIELGKK